MSPGRLCALPIDCRFRQKFWWTRRTNRPGRAATAASRLGIATSSGCPAAVVFGVGRQHAKPLRGRLAPSAARSSVGSSLTTRRRPSSSRSRRASRGRGRRTSWPMWPRRPPTDRHFRGNALRQRGPRPRSRAHAERWHRNSARTEPSEANSKPMLGRPAWPPSYGIRLRIAAKTSREWGCSACAASATHPSSPDLGGSTFNAAPSQCALGCWSACFRACRSGISTRHRGHRADDCQTIRSTTDPGSASRCKSSPRAKACADLAGTGANAAASSLRAKAAACPPNESAPSWRMRIEASLAGHTRRRARCR